MDKIIKCILVDVDNVLISEIEEVDAALGDPNCKLTKPYRFFVRIIWNLRPKGTNETELMIRAENILTIADPSPEVVEAYLKLTE